MRLNKLDCLKPLVTIVIIAYNEERYIDQAIKSALNQTYSNIEIVVIDDGSRDNTVAIAKRYEPRIKVYSQNNSGNCSFPRNSGLAKSEGKYVSFLDADDILLPQKIARQVEVLQANPNAAYIVNDYCNFRNEVVEPNHFSTCPRLNAALEKFNSSAVTFAPGKGADLMLQENFTIASSPLFDTEILKSEGGFATDLYACEDYHLNYRLASKYAIVVDQQILFHRRLHGNNMSFNSIKMSKYYFKSRMHLMRNEEQRERKLALRNFSRKMYWRYVKNSLRQGLFKEISLVIKGYFLLYLF